ncbi:MAG: TonB-dependent receptor [Sphingobium sp.]
MLFKQMLKNDVESALMRCIAGAMVAPLFLSGAAAAQSQAPDTQAQSGTAANSDSGFGEIVVTAERRNARVVETPISMVALSGEQLASSGATEMRDLTKTVPGLRMASYSTSSFPAIRGISTGATGIGVSSNTAIYLDGFYLASPDVLNFEFPDLENIQVLKGPQGTLFGRNATGGAILLTTRGPSDTLEGNVSVGYGTFDEKLANAYISGPLTDRISASLSGSWLESDGYVYNIYRQSKDGWRKNWNVRGKLNIEATDNLTLKLQLEHLFINDPRTIVNHSVGESVSPGAAAGVVATNRYETSSAVQSISRRELDSVFFTAEQKLGSATLTSRTGYFRQKQLSVFDFDGSSEKIVDFAAAARMRTFTQELILAGSTGPLEWSAGAFYFRDRAKMPYAASNDFAYVTDAVNTDAWAVYVDATYNIAPKLYLTGGVRYSHEKKRFIWDELGYTGDVTNNWNAVTPRAVIRYQIQPSTSIYASWSKGFNGGVYPAYSPAEKAADPEKVNAFELGFKHQQHGFSFDLAGFYYKYRDMQYNAYTAIDGNVVSSLTNVGRATIYGIEGSVRGEVVDGFTVYAGGSWVHGKYDDFRDAVIYQPLEGGGYEQVPHDATGNQLIRSPRFSANIGGEVRQPLFGGYANLNANVYYTAKIYDDPANQFKIPGATFLDLTAGWTTADEKWQIMVIGKNMTNVHYLTYYDPSTDAILANEGAPRTVRVQLTRKF